MKRLALGLLLSTASMASAGTFRGGTANWQLRDPSAPHAVSFTVTTFWDEPTSDSTNLDLDFGDGTTSGPLTFTTLYTGSTAALGQGFTIRQATTTHVYAADGTYTATIAGCCRHATRNAAGTDAFRLATTVALGTGSYGSPVALVVDPEAEADLLGLDVSLPSATWWGGYGIGGHISSLAESGLSPPANASLTLEYAPDLVWRPTGTAPGESYTVSVVLDDIGGSSAMLELILEIVPPVPLAPYCLFSPAVLGAQPGATVTATEEAGGDTSHAVYTPIPSTLGATITRTNSSSILSWTPAAGDEGLYGVAIDRIVDPTNHVSHTCAVRLHAPRTSTTCEMIPNLCGANTTCMPTSFGITCACKPGYDRDDSPIACKIGGCYVVPETCGFSLGYPVGLVCCPDPPSAPTGYTCRCPISEGPGGQGGNGGSDQTGSEQPGASPAGGGCSSGSGAVGIAMGFVISLGLRRRRSDPHFHHPGRLHHPRRRPVRRVRRWARRWVRSRRGGR